MNRQKIAMIFLGVMTGLCIVVIGLSIWVKSASPPPTSTPTEPEVCKWMYVKDVSSGCIRAKCQVLLDDDTSIILDRPLKNERRLICRPQSDWPSSSPRIPLTFSQRLDRCAFEAQQQELESREEWTLYVRHCIDHFDKLPAEASE